MKALRDFTRGIAASFSGHALAALGWTYAAVLAVGLAFTVVVYRFVAATVQHSAMAADLRGGQSAGWLVDLIGREGTSASVASLMTTATVLAPVYLVLVIFFSGGVLSKVRAGLGLGGPERFLAASARHAGTMARVASLEVVVVGILAAILFLGVSAAAVADVGHPVAWLTLAVALVVLAIVTSLFDYARVAVVANDDGSALGALRGGIELLGRSPMSVVVLALLNGAVGLVVFLLAVWVHSVAPLDTGAGVLVGLLVGQAGLAARLWSRIAAYAAETSLWERARAV